MSTEPEPSRHDMAPALPSLAWAVTFIARLSTERTLRGALRYLIDAAQALTAAPHALAFVVEQDTPVCAALSVGLVLKKKADAPRSALHQLASMCDTLATGQPFIGTRPEGHYASFFDRPLASLASIPIPFVSHTGQPVFSGTLAILSDTPSQFTDKHLPILSGIANLAAPFLSNIHAIDTYRRTHALIGAVLKQEPLGSLAVRVADEFDCSECHVYFKARLPFRTDGESLHLAALAPKPSSLDRPLWEYNGRLDATDALESVAFNTKATTHIHNLSDDTELHATLPTLTDTQLLAPHNGAEHLLLIPMDTDRGERVGLLRVSRTGDGTDFTSEESRDLKTVADAIGQTYVAAEALEWLSAIVEGAAEPMLVTRRRGGTLPAPWVVEHANKAAVDTFGFELCDLLGQDARQLYGPREAKQIRRKLGGRQSLNRYKTEFAHVSGSRIPILLNATVKRSRITGEMHTFGHLIDLQQQAAERLLEFENLISDFAHEILTPMQAMRYDADVLVGMLDEFIVTWPFLRDVYNHADRLRGEAESFSARADALMAAIAKEKPMCEFAWTDISELIKDIVRVYRGLARKKGVELDVTTDAPGQAIKAEIDERSFQQAIRYLLENAIKYADAGTTTRDSIVEIHTTRERGDIMCEISNVGIGIYPWERDLVWKRGERGEWAKRALQEGSGLGLAAVKEIVELHSGKVRCWSEPIGQSEGPWRTRFELRVPRAQAV